MASDRTWLSVLPSMLMALMAAGCCECRSNAPAGPASRVRAVEDVGESPLIVRLEGRNYSITASSGPVGVIYTAHRRDGSLLVANATLEELRQRHPEIYQQILPGIAEKAESSDGRARTVTDAEHDASTDGPVPLSGRTSGNRELLMMDAEMHSAR